MDNIHGLNELNERLISVVDVSERQAATLQRISDKLDWLLDKISQEGTETKKELTQLLDEATK